MSQLVARMVMVRGMRRLTCSGLAPNGMSGRPNLCTHRHADADTGCVLDVGCALSAPEDCMLLPAACQRQHMVAATGFLLLLLQS
jgi:hypothetical protein